MIDNYKTYAIEYQHEGSVWVLHIQATSWQDAEQRLRALQFGSVFGEIQMEVPAWVPLGSLWARLICWLRNRRAWSSK